MPSPVAEIAFCEDGLAVASALGSGLLPWTSLTEIWERPGYWMIFSGAGQFNTLPIEAIPDEDLQWLRSRIVSR
ncbi:YcxB family protein [Plastoroseomonas hellenica]|uniref:YcxB family protein n=1 Tax=Plastoroseomonas hellenica TaxID=2687306 RepID=UPI001BAB9C09|nr:YcxB family protein [Plastoroseomonas hellenica]MBR0645607.1 YcxB family protein [Plastoroseomonas hellenica]